MPNIHDIIDIIHASNKGLNQCFLTAKFRAGIYRFLDCHKYFLILSVTVVIFFYQHQDVININFNLLYQFNLKYNIIRNIRTFSRFPPPLPFIMQILIFSKIILKISLIDDFFARKIIKQYKQVFHPQNGTKQGNKVLLVLLAENLRDIHRELRLKFFNHIYIPRHRPPIYGFVSVIVILEALHQHDSTGILISE